MTDVTDINTLRAAIKAIETEIEQKQRAFKASIASLYEQKWVLENEWFEHDTGLRIGDKLVVTSELEANGIFRVGEVVTLSDGYPGGCSVTSDDGRTMRLYSDTAQRMRFLWLALYAKDAE